MIKLPTYTSHKKVEAGKIVEIAKVKLSTMDGADDPTDDGRMYMLLLDIPGRGEPYPQMVVKDYLDKHQPEVGGYFVRYADGYCSYSPAKAFEEGYSLSLDGAGERFPGVDIDAAHRGQ